MRRLTLLLFLLSTLLQAQTSTGQIDVVVQDPTGAVIPNATVTITGSATGNLARTLSTNESGVAEAPLLPPESYDVVVTMQGFEKLIRRALVLNVGDVLNLRLTLTPGNTNTEITVIGQTPLL